MCAAIFTRIFPRKAPPFSTGLNTAKVDVMNRIPPADIAAQIIKQYDTNENGQLEVEEWSQLPGKPKVFDTNSDDVISLEELAAAITSSRRITSATHPTE